MLQQQSPVDDQANELIFRLMDFVPVPLLISAHDSQSDNIQAERQHIFINKAFLQQIGYDMQEMPTIQAFFQLAYRDEQLREFRYQQWLDAVADSIQAGRTVAEVTTLIQCKNGQQRWFSIAAEIVSNIKPEWHMVSFRDVHELKHTLDEVEQLSRIDPLTQLANRREGTRALEAARQLALETVQQFSVLLCDLDRFKEINDLFGHDCGDEVLRVVAQTLRDAARLEDCVARWGGEEFLVVLPQTRLADAVWIAERLRTAVNQLSCEWQGQYIMPTISIGVAVQQATQSIDQLIKAADQALYQAKHLGRNLVWFTAAEGDAPQ